MSRTAAVSSLDQREVLRRPLGEWFVLAGIVRDPDRRTRLCRWLGLDRDAFASIVLAFERDVVLGPQLLEQRNPLDQPTHAVTGRKPVQLAFDPCAGLLDNAGAADQHGSTA